jgi:hypothetical protein
MQLSAKLTMITCGAFAVLCLCFAINGFMSLGGITDPEQLSDARGFAWFWTFLASVAIVFGLLSWWIMRTGREE